MNTTALMTLGRAADFRNGIRGDEQPAPAIRPLAVSHKLLRSRQGGIAAIGVSAGEPVVTADTSRSTVQELWQRYHRSADAQTENALTEQYLPLVAAIRGRLATTLPDHVDIDDLHSAGLVGLLQALRNYDPASGVPFEAYARVRIRGAMLDELRRMDWVPRTIHDKARKLQVALAELEQTLGRAPTDRELALALNISVTEFGELRDEVRPATFLCLDAAISTEEEDGRTPHEIVADVAEGGTDEQVSRRELQAIVLARLQELPDMQRKVLALYYGEDLRLREIAEAFGLTESRICQIHSQAIRSIRAYMQQFEAGLTRHATPAARQGSPRGNPTLSATLFPSWPSAN